MHRTRVFIILSSIFHLHYTSVENNKEKKLLNSTHILIKIIENFRFLEIDSINEI